MEDTVFKKKGGAREAESLCTSSFLLSDKQHTYVVSGTIKELFPRYEKLFSNLSLYHG